MVYHFIFGFTEKVFTVIFFIMTIKARNRFYMGFFIFTLIVFVFDLIFFHYQIFAKSLSVPEVKLPESSSASFLFGFKPVFSYSGIFFQFIYLCGTSFTILYAFYKTQAGELAYFLLFLLSILLDTARIFIPLLNLAGSFHTALIAINNIVLTGTFLGPVSLMALVLFSGEEYRQNLEQNCVIIIVASTFVAFSIPINTGVLLPNFTSAAAFSKIIRLFIVVSIIISVLSICMNNYKRELSQITTLGFFVLGTGSLILKHCYTLFQLIIGVIFISVGTVLYFKDLHNQYLWNS